MKKLKALSYPYIIWIAVMILVPMLLIVFYAFTEKGNDVTVIRFTLENFVRFVTDKTFLEVLARSLYIAVLTTAVCLLIGYPAAYIISRLGDRSNMIMVLLITLPTLVNMLVRTYAWRSILGTGGLISSVLSLFGLEGVGLTETTFAVVLGMVYNFLPFMILQINTSLSKMDKSYIEAANDLGASSVQAFMRITFPLSLPGVISGITLVFLPSVSSFFIPSLLGGRDFVLLGNLIETQFTKGSWNFGSAISLVMAVIILFSMFLTKKLDKEPESAGKE